MSESDAVSTHSARRYARHTVLSEIGEAGQARLAESAVLVIGAGGLGAQCAAFLNAMGVGRIGLVDDDRVELSNLQRQLLYEEGDIGRSKVVAAKEALQERNADTHIEIITARATAENVEAMLQDYDLVCDGSDNFATRMLMNRVCYQTETPLISAAITGFEMQLSTFKAYLGPPHPCYQCFVPEVPADERNCEREGILGAVAGVAGSMQAVEAVKELLGIGRSLSGRIFYYDALAGRGREMLLKRDKGCPICHSSSRS